MTIVYNPLFLGLLAPGSLREGGWLGEWVQEAKDFGEELRRGLEGRLVRVALPENPCAKAVPAFPSMVMACPCR